MTGNFWQNGLMVRVAYLTCAFLLLSAPFSYLATAAEGTASALGPKELVERTIVDLLTAIKRDKETIRQDSGHAAALVEEILSPHVDYDRVTRLVLGRYWRQATPEQRQRFVDEFRALQLRTYAAALTQVTDVKIVYLPVRQGQRKDDVMVRTHLPRAGTPPVEIAYRLHSANGVWRVYDVLVEGVSLLTTFRRTFSTEIRKVGIDGLIDQIAAKNR